MKSVWLFALVASYLLTPNCIGENRLTVKYRTTPVDVEKPYFEALDTSDSSFVQGAWYDASKQYMVVNLSGVNYHYCALPTSTWNGFKSASSFGKFFNAHIKGNFDCRVYPAPAYDR